MQTDRALSPQPPHSPDRDECSDSPNPCSHSCHNAPGRFSCSCPAGFALARDDRNCRGEWAQGQKLSLELGWVCAGHSGARTPARDTPQDMACSGGIRCQARGGNTLFPLGISCYVGGR